jgi:hypothetical protein
MNSNKALKKIKIGIYQLQPNTQNNTCKFVEKGYAKYGKNFDDEKLDLDFLQNNTEIKFKIEKTRVKYDDTVYFEFFKDNLASTYITKTTKVPVFHCSVMYQKKVILGNLFNIYLFYNIAEAKSYTSFKQLIDSELKGRFELVIEFSDRTDVLPFDTFTNYNDIITDLLELFSTETMSEIIANELDKKDDERIQKFGRVDNYEIPDKILNFDDLVKKYQETNGDMEKVISSNF